MEGTDMHSAEAVAAAGSGLRGSACALRVVAVLAIFSCAAWLSPSARGFGTHTALGLPPCPFYALFRLPCASCGLTTALSELVHLAPLRSFAAHPLGIPLAGLLVAEALWNARGLVRPPRTPAPRAWAWSQRRLLLGVLCLVWGIRLVAGV